MQKSLNKIKILDDRDEVADFLPKNGVGAELGVHRGVFSTTLLQLAKPHKLYLVDLFLPKHEELGYSAWGDYRAKLQRKFSAEITMGQVEIIQQNSTEFLHSLDTDSLDWLYIDTDHTYDTTVQEIARALAVVKPGGIISGHDFAIVPNWWKCGVVAAVLEFVNSGMLTIEALSNEEFPSWIARVTNREQ